ncbi:MAG: shikimate kinase [Candidatus Dadabacteria bacterium]|nr:shikimate kinase [Candidatus Dadabacteria bacterium]NIS09982.1 shikimate kinase [Candidatus Dadabacteria bacterium]NIY22957.1 shikimate kinase [Candidatus Dadabacteria bacterium]
MGAGKTTVGKMLAPKINFGFIDMDSEIELISDLSISEIFKIHGERYFRDLETGVLKDISQKSDQVVSTGGGIVIKEENWEIMKSSGRTIYLKASIETLFNRVKHKTTRPLLDVEDPFETAKELLESREPLYKKSDLIIDRERLEPDEVAEAIVKELGI